MKFLPLPLSAAALVALAASPAPAASRHHVRHSYGGNYASGYYGRPLNSGGVNSPGPIYRQGQFLGTRPHPPIPEEILRGPYFSRRRSPSRAKKRLSESSRLPHMAKMDNHHCP